MRSENGTSPMARSPWECHLYIEQRSCVCGRAGFDVTEHVELLRDRVPIWQYEAECGECGHTELFEFRAPDDPTPAYPAFGGDAPSQLLDAGQFLEVATAAADRVPADPGEVPPDDFDDAYETIFIAVAAMQEVLKFVPAGRTEVPREALWAPASLAAYDERPDRYARRRLMADLGAYRQVQAAYSRVAD
jgi:hypothetical protein